MISWKQIAEHPINSTAQQILLASVGEGEVWDIQLVRIEEVPFKSVGAIYWAEVNFPGGDLLNRVKDGQAHIYTNLQAAEGRHPFEPTDQEIINYLDSKGFVPASEITKWEDDLTGVHEWHVYISKKLSVTIDAEASMRAVLEKLRAEGKLDWLLSV